jgi:CelD/BcsL family acetyltransferase involved in cellulose biosynthesis
VRTELYAGSLEELAPEWETVYTADPHATPFVSPGWGLAWMKHWGTDADPWIVTVRDGDGSLVGLAPLAIERRGPVRAVRLIGKEPGDYWDVLALPEHRDAVAREVAREMAQRDEEWDVFTFDGQPGLAASESVFASQSLRVRSRAPVRCPRITLPAEFEAYLKELPGSHRQNVRKVIRRLDGGDVTLHEVRDVERLDVSIPRWHELHMKRWEEHREAISPTHRTSTFRDFLLDATRALLPQERAAVWEFHMNGDVVGVYLNFLDSDSFYWYLGGFEPKLSKLGVGKMSIAHGIRWSIESGRRYFDFTRGEESFKYYYGAVDRHIPSLVVGNARLRSRSAFAATGVREGIRRSLRSVRDAVPGRASLVTIR